MIVVFILINWTAKGIRSSLRKKKKEETIINAIFSTYRKVNVHKIFKKTKNGIKMYIKRPKPILKRPLFRL